MNIEIPTYDYDYRKNFPLKVRQIVSEIVRETNQGWSVDFGDQSDNYAWNSAHIRRLEDEATVYVHTDEYKEHRFEFSVSHFKLNGETVSPHNWIGYHDHLPRASTAFGRPSERIAKEVVRKVIRPYDPLHAKVIESRRADREREANAYAAAKRIALIIGCNDVPDEKPRHGESWHLYAGGDDGLRVEVRRTGSVEISIHPDNTARAEKILSRIYLRAAPGGQCGDVYS